MKTEMRFVLAIGLMLAVLIGTNRLFPPPPMEDVAVTSPVETGEALRGPDSGRLPPSPQVSNSQPSAVPGGDEGAEEEPLGAEDAGLPVLNVIVEGPLYRHVFTSRGAQLISAELLDFQAINRGGPVQVVPDGASGYLGSKVVVEQDTLDLTDVVFRVEPAGGLNLTAESGPKSLAFVYDHPSGNFTYRVSYTFDPDDYTIGIGGSMDGVTRALLVTDLGEGLAYAEADSALEQRSMAYVYNHLQDGIRSTMLDKADPEIIEGPLVWAAFRSKFFVTAMLSGARDEDVDDTGYLGGLLVRPADLPERVRVGVARTVSGGEEYAYRLFIGPQQYALLSSLGDGMEEVNPYGWRFFRPIIRPFVSIIMTVLTYLHTQFSMGYGWVLIVFGVMMRVVLFPLNHKAMKAQLRNMAVQPLVKQIQDKHKDNPEKLQKEMMKLYKEHGFNPLAGCLPMLLPWPVLIALFFVFQNTIELRGVPFLWLPDLSAKDPFYVLPVLLAVSMFLMQWISLRSLDTDNPQMKMMMYIMPPMMLFIFMNLASGLNLYYATANIATLPQQIWIARERKRMRQGPALTLSDGD